MSLPGHDENLKRWYADDAKHQLRSNYPLTEKSVIFDVGSYNGDWALQMYKKYNCAVYAFEPVKEFFLQLEEKSENTKIIPFQLALGGSDRKDKIFLSKDGSSMFLSTLETESIVVRNIVDFIAEHKLEKVDLIKINIESAEYELLDAMLDADIASKFGNLQIQFHPDVPDYDAKRKSIQDRLSKTHRQTYCYDWIWENWAKK